MLRHRALIVLPEPRSWKWFRLTAAAGERRGMRHNFAWTLLGNAATGGFQVLTLCLIAKQLSTDALGLYALALAIIQPVIALCSLQLRPMLASGSLGAHPFRHFLLLRVTGHVIAAGIILAIAVHRSDLDWLAVVLPLAVVRLVTATSDLYYARMQQHERMDYVAKSQMMSQAVQVLALASALWLAKDLPLACWAMAAAATLILVTYDIPVSLALARLAAKPSGVVAAARPPARLCKLAKMALPLGCVTGAVALTASLPRYLLDHFQTTRDVGIFAALVCPGALLQQCVVALAQVSLPRFGEYYRKRDRVAFVCLLRRTLLINLGFALLTVAGSVIVGGPVISLLFQPDVAQHAQSLIWIMVAFALNAIGAYGGVLTAAQRYHTQFVISLFTLAATGVFGWLLIPQGGIHGAALALVLAAAIRLGAMWISVAWIVAEFDRCPSRDFQSHCVASSNR